MSYSILIVEDDRRLNEIVYDYLEVDGYQVHQAYSGIEALDIFNKESIDLVLLDIMIPGLDGFSVCRKIRQKSDVLIIIVSARNDETDKIMGFDLGADEYVTKPFSPKVLLKRINALLDRCSNKTSVTSKDLIIKKNLTVDIDGFKAMVSGSPISLTSKEFSMLSLLICHEGKVFTRAALIDSVWGYDYDGTDRVIDTNIKTLRKKLGACSHYVQTVINVGYKFEVNL